MEISSIGASKQRILHFFVEKGLTTYVEKLFTSYNPKWEDYPILEPAHPLILTIIARKYAMFDILARNIQNKDSELVNFAKHQLCASCKIIDKDDEDDKKEKKTYD